MDTGGGRDPFDPYNTGNLGETEAADTRFVSVSISGCQQIVTTMIQDPPCSTVAVSAAHIRIRGFPWVPFILIWLGGINDAAPES